MAEDYWYDFDLIMNPELQRLKHAAQVGIRDVTMEATRNGALAGSTAIILTVQVAAQSVSRQIRSAFLTLMRATNAHGVPITNANRARIVAKLTEWSALRIDEMEDVAKKSAAFKAVGNTSLKFLLPIRKAAELELQSITGEVNLIAAQHESRIGKTAAIQSVVFNAPVGQAIIGTGSMGVFVGAMDHAMRHALLSALTAIETEIQDDQVELDAPKEDVRELIQEARLEIDKPNPNMTRVKSVIAGIGGAISYAPKVKAAYDALKWAASLVGVTLP